MRRTSEAGWLRPAIVVLAIAVASAAAGCGGNGETGGPTPTAGPTTSTVITPAARPAEVGFTTDDGLTLRGTLFGTGSTGVVLAHMRPSDQTSWFDFARTLAEQGFTALTFDFRGYGDSDGPGELGLIDLDVLAAVRFLRTQGVDTVFIVGASMGGTAGAAVADRAGAAGLATLSAPATFEGIDGRAGAARLAVPALFVAAEDDGSYADDARSLAAEVPGGNAEVLVLPGSRHGTDLFADHGPELGAALLDLIGQG